MVQWSELVGLYLSGIPTCHGFYREIGAWNGLLAIFVEAWTLVKFAVTSNALVSISFVLVCLPFLLPPCTCRNCQIWLLKTSTERATQMSFDKYICQDMRP